MLVLCVVVYRRRPRWAGRGVVLAVEVLMDERKGFMADVWYRLREQEISKMISLVG